MKKAGRPINVKAAQQVAEYLAKGLNQYEVARVMGKPRQQIFRWVKYLNDGLIPPKENNVDMSKE